MKEIACAWSADKWQYHCGALVQCYTTHKVLHDGTHIVLVNLMSTWLIISLHRQILCHIMSVFITNLHTLYTTILGILIHLSACVFSHESPHILYYDYTIIDLPNKSTWYHKDVHGGMLLHIQNIAESTTAKLYILTIREIKLNEIAIMRSRNKSETESEQ